MVGPSDQGGTTWIGRRKERGRDAAHTGKHPAPLPGGKAHGREGARACRALLGEHRHSVAFRTVRQIERNSDAVTAPSVPASTSRAKSTLGFRSPAKARERVLGDRPIRTANAERRSLFSSRKY